MDKWMFHFHSGHFHEKVDWWVVLVVKTDCDNIDMFDLNKLGHASSSDLVSLTFHSGHRARVTCNVVMSSGSVNCACNKLKNKNMMMQRSSLS